ncbi:MAG: hypothetical protein JNL18_18000 [Planctomycetaceae bacterium]|nr:hypothetical protein [Planctomycetaceae bacterium]
MDPQSGSIIGEICHIKGDKSGAARYDVEQADEQRQGFDNLILLCNVHHKVVDDDEAVYTVDRLTQMKRDHEDGHKTQPAIDATTVDNFVDVAIANSLIEGSVITSIGQTGGQVAHSITNIYSTPFVDDVVELDAKLAMENDLSLVAATGCPGMKLTVINRGTRQAKIQKAYLLVANVEVMKGMQQGFGTDFGYTPIPGMAETLGVQLIPLSRPNSAEGWVLDRDDVARFFYPLPIPATTLALRAKPEDVSIAVRYFDESETTLLSGDQVTQILETVMAAHGKQPGSLNGPIEYDVRVRSSTPVDMSAHGKVNENYLPMAEREEEGVDPPAPEKHS